VNLWILSACYFRRVFDCSQGWEYLLLNWVHWGKLPISFWGLNNIKESKNIIPNLVWGLNEVKVTSFSPEYFHHILILLCARLHFQCQFNFVLVNCIREYTLRLGRFKNCLTLGIWLQVLLERFHDSLWVINCFELDTKTLRFIFYHPFKLVFRFFNSLIYFEFS